MLAQLKDKLDAPSKHIIVYAFAGRSITTVKVALNNYLTSE